MSHTSEDYYFAIRRAHDLLSADTQRGALALLPAGGIECESKVEQAVAILREQLEHPPA